MIPSLRSFRILLHGREVEHQVCLNERATRLVERHDLAVRMGVDILHFKLVVEFLRDVKFSAVLRSEDVRYLGPPCFGALFALLPEPMRANNFRVRVL